MTNSALVTLSEVLQVRGEPLKEEELWSVIEEAAQLFSTIFLQDNLALRSNGSFELIQHEETDIQSAYLPPEANSFNPDAEKILVFSLGMTVYRAADYHLEFFRQLDIGDNLRAIMCHMCAKFPSDRASLSTVEEAFNKHCLVHRNRTPSRVYLKRLYRSVLGSVSDKPSAISPRSCSQSAENLVERLKPGGGDGLRESTSSPMLSQSTGNLLAHGTMEFTPPKRIPKGVRRVSTSTDSLVPKRYCNKDLQETYRKIKERREKLKYLYPERQDLSQSLLNGADDVGFTSSESSYTRGTFIPLLQRKELDDRRGLMHGYHGDLSLHDDYELLRLQQKDLYEQQKRADQSRTKLQKWPQTTDKPRQQTAGDTSQRVQAETPKQITPEKQSSLNREQLKHQQSIRDKSHDRTSQLLQKSSPVSQNLDQTTIPRNSEKTGPEFIWRSSLPEVKITLSTVQTDGRDSRRLVHIVLLNGQQLKVVCHVHSVCQQLFHAAVQYLQLVDQHLFEGEHFFVNNAKKLWKIAPVAWKESKNRNVTFTLYFRVKFYVGFELINSTPQLVSLFYLQLRRDIMEGRLRVNKTYLLSISASALQVEYGDFARNQKNYFVAEHYIPKMSDIEASRLRSLHVEKEGTSKEKARIDFIATCMACNEYGYHFHKLQKKREKDSAPLFLGIGLQGIVVAGQRGFDHRSSQGYSSKWEDLGRVTYNRRCFKISGKNNKAQKHVFYAENQQRARYLLALCSDHHKFQLSLVTRADLSSLFIESTNASTTSRTDLKDEDPVNESEFLYDNIPAADVQNSVFEHHDSEDDTEVDGISPMQVLNLKYGRERSNQRDEPSRASSPYKVVLMKQAQGLGLNITGGVKAGSTRRGIYVKSLTSGGAADAEGSIRQGDRLISVNGVSLDGLSHSEAVQLLLAAPSLCALQLERKPHPSSHKERYSPDGGEILDDVSAVSSLSIEDEESEAFRNVDQPTLLHANVTQAVNHSVDIRQATPSPVTNFEQVAGLLDTYDAEEDSSDIYEISLSKGAHGLGFTVAGGNQTTGYIYVKEILFDPARSNAFLRCGHQLVEVNGVNVSGLSHAEAVGLLRSTSSKVKLKMAKKSLNEERPRNAVDLSDDDSDTLSEVSSLPSLLSDDVTTQELDTLYKEEVARIGTEEEIEKDVLRVVLQKPIMGSIGINLIEAEGDGGRTLYVDDVTSGGIAARDGRLRKGDRLLQVDGSTVIGMAHSKAAALIRASKGSIELVVTRSHGDQMPEVADDLSNKADCVDDEEEARHQPVGNIDSEIPAEKDFAQQHTVRISPLSQLLSVLDQHSSPGEERPSTSQSHAAPLMTSPTPSAADDANNREMDTESTLLDRQSEFPQVVVPQNHRPRAASSNNSRYSGSQLYNTVRQLSLSIQRGEHLEEFKNLRFVKLTDVCAEGRKIENRDKNRFRNVLPYDSNRVKISGESSYINASHISYKIGEDLLKFIATQGPLNSTVEDFWSMIWEQEVTLIVMLTREIEAGKVKSQRYWPQNEATLTFNSYRVTSEKEVNGVDFDVSYMWMYKEEGGVKRPVTQIRVNQWDELGCERLLELVQLIDKLKRHGPLLVHCSTGIGRTGVFLTVSIILHIVANDDAVKLSEIVTRLRRQRQGIIQTKDQYTLCYNVYLQLLKNIIANKNGHD